VTRVIVIAKEPRTGRAKTRLCPPCTYEEAACLARASLEDTLAAMAATAGLSPFLALDGSPDGLDVPPSFSVLPQRGSGLEERLAAAFQDIGAPALLIGMDTPQVTPQRLRDAITIFRASDGAVLGPARDGGYWAIGLKEASDAVFQGIPMSSTFTYAAQRARLLDLGLSVTSLPVLTDVDDIATAVEVAGVAPETRFARQLGSIRAGWETIEPADA
jgi:rSAM/selenodomain-associated transferase 1